MNFKRFLVASTIILFAIALLIRQCENNDIEDDLEISSINTKNEIKSNSDNYRISEVTENFVKGEVCERNDGDIDIYKTSIDTAGEVSPSHTTLSNYIIQTCLPSPLSGVSESIIYRKAYVVSYNKDTRNPNWVAWHLTAEHADGPCGRSDDFYEDDEVEAPRATLADYHRSGWSRGHMCPAGDNKWDEEAMHESFSLVNICPQDTRLNSGLWNSIEMNCRTWARRYGDIYIVCGPVYLNREHVTIGANRVVVPEAFFKVVLCLNGTPKAFGIVVRNNSGQRNRDLYYNSVDEVERVTGMDFFHTLPDDIENEVEATANIEEW